MDHLTLVIPAKKESESLPIVLEELEKYNLKKIIVLEKDDMETIASVKEFNCKILTQKNRGYGDALIQGIKSVQSKYFAIFNADGSFNPIELKEMYNSLENDKADIIFASRYEKGCKSDDDTIVTWFGNYFFTYLGKIFFKLPISDILYTFVMGKTDCFKSLDITQKDFRFCVEFPIKANRLKKKIITSKSHERSRISGKKKVNAMKDGFLILIAMFSLFFQNR